MREGSNEALKSRPVVGSFPQDDKALGGLRPGRRGFLTDELLVVGEVGGGRRAVHRRVFGGHLWFLRT